MATKYYPIILVRGFDPLGSSQRDPYTGFNDGTAYTDAVYASRDFEGFVIAFLKGAGAQNTLGAGLHAYRDTINLIRFHPPKAIPSPQLGFDNADSCFSQADPVALARLRAAAQSPEFASDPEHPNRKTFWVFNYYASLQGAIWRRLGFAAIPYFARELQRYIAVVKEYTGAQKVNLVAHSMGGIILRHLVQRRYFVQAEAERHINRVVTLGSPLAGISYLNNNVLDAIRDYLGLDASELDSMDPKYLGSPAKNTAYPGSDDIFNYEIPKDTYGVVSTKAEAADPRIIAGQWNPRRWLCVIGTDPETYAWKLGWVGAMWRGGGGRSDGLVLQDNAYLRGGPRVYLFKCHGGVDSLITSRESYEVVKRFLFGTHDIKVSINEGSRINNYDRHAYYRAGCKVKVRDVDFCLHQMDPASKNCIYLNHPEHPPEHLSKADLAEHPEWKMYINRAGVFTQPLTLYEGALDMQLSQTAGQMVFRFDFGVWAEDIPGFFDVLGRLGLGHSDYAIVCEQYMAAYSSQTNQLLWFHDPKSALKIAGAEQLDNPLPEENKLEDGSLPVGMLLDRIATDLMAPAGRSNSTRTVAAYDYRSGVDGSGGFDEVVLDTPGFTGSLRIEVVAREDP